ncbi:MAG: CmcJ/NvfI family oxidoreductase, partial [Kiloniellales bacterium]|nr:CmcJ/NvfI family oxidoreductase [Kiloniellales bacterium]
MNQIVSNVSPRPTQFHSATGLRAPLNFIRRQDSKPVTHSAALTGTSPRHFFKTEAHEVLIEDMRGIAGSLSLDREGFKLLGFETEVEDLYDDDAVRQRYYPEIESLLRRELGASRVIVFDATRRSDNGIGARNPDGLRGPAGRVHVDYTVKSGPRRLEDLVGEAEATRLADTGSRIVQVNVWRPIHGPVERSPLALADASSVDARDLIATDQVFADRVGEIYHLAYDPSQRWYYAPLMTRNEVLLIKGWDSLEDGRAQFTPHSAFDPLHVSDDAPPRESIEVRTFA